MSKPEDRFVTPPLAMVPVLGGSAKTREDLVSGLSYWMSLNVRTPISDPTADLFVSIMRCLADELEEDGGSEIQMIAVRSAERAMASMTEADLRHVLDDLDEVPPVGHAVRRYLYSLLVDALVLALDRWPVDRMVATARTQGRLFSRSPEGPRLIVSRGRARRPPRRRSA